MKQHKFLCLTVVIFLFVSTIFVGCKHEIPTPSDTVNGYTKALLTGDTKDLVSYGVISKKKAKQFSTDLKKEFTSILKEAASASDFELTTKEANKLVDTQLKRLEKLSYDTKENTKDKTATVTLSIDSLDYTTLASTLKSNIQKEISDGKLTNKTQLRDLIIASLQSFIEESTTSDQRQKIQVNLELKNVTIDKKEKERWVLSDETTFLKELKEALITYE